MNIIRGAMLLDFYGPLLTDKQRQTFEDHVCNDISISEIAESEGVSRQAVHDMIKRCNAILEDYESKLRLVEKFMYIKEKVKLIDEAAASDSVKNNQNIMNLTREILEEL